MKKTNFGIKKISALLLTATLTISMVMPVFADELLIEDTLLTDTLSDTSLNSSEDILSGENTVTTADSDTVSVETDENSTGNDNYYQWILKNDPGIIWMPIEDDYAEDWVYAHENANDGPENDILNQGINNDKVSQINVIHEWPNTQLTKEEREWTINRVKQIVAENITDDMSDLEKYWTLAHWVKNNISYPDLDSDFYKNRIYAHDTLHGPYGTLKYGYGVCQGNTLLYSLLCHAAGLPCDEVPTVKEVNHILNYIPNINGHSYYIDTTANDFLASDIALQPLYNKFTDVSKTYKGYIDADNIICNDNSFVFKESADFDINNIGYSITKNRPAPIKFGELSYSYIFENLIKSDDILTIDTYVEKGSGTPGIHYAHYTDYALQQPLNTGNWELDDFYENPRNFLPSIYDANISGLKDYYDINIYNEDLKVDDAKLAELKELIYKDIVLTLDGTELIQNIDYRISEIGNDGQDNSGKIFINIEGSGNYGGGLTLYAKVNKVLNTEKLTVDIYEGLTITKSILGKGTSNIYDVSYTDETIAGLSEKGVIKGLKPGTTIITVTKDDVKYVVDVTVKEADKLETTLVTGGKVTFNELTKTSVDGKNYKIAYSTKGIVTLSNKGILQGKKAGTTVVTVTKADSIHIINATVIAPTFAAKTFAKNTEDTFNCGFDVQGLDVVYTSSKPGIASVDSDGNVRAVSKGTAKITALVQGKKYTTTVKVYDPVMNGKNLVKVNKTITLSIKGGCGRTQWSVDDSSIATITAGGKLKGLSSGTVTVTAINNGRKMSKEIIVE